jgi:hypothetical protein
VCFLSSIRNLPKQGFRSPAPFTEGSEDLDRRKDKAKVAAERKELKTISLLMPAYRGH